MRLFTNLLISFIAVLHVYFLILEMFLWTKPKGLKTFGQSLEQAKSSATLAANQGLYNGFLAAGLLWSLLQPSPDFAQQLKFFFVGCVFAAGIYGGYSVNKKIALVQGLPAAIGLICLILF